MRRRNYFLNRAERLDGNIGYLEVRRFFGLADDALDAARRRDGVPARRPTR